MERALDIVSESEDTRDEVSRLIEENRQSFEDPYRQNREDIYQVSLRINATHDNITILNKMERVGELFRWTPLSLCEQRNFEATIKHYYHM